MNTFVHRVTVPVQAKQNGLPLPNTRLAFSFEGNVGHDFGNGQAPKTAKFLWNNAQGQSMQTETLTLTTDDSGNASLTILSSDVVSQPSLVAQWTNAQGQVEEVGRVTCDFAAMTSRRGFPDPVAGAYTGWEGDDTGWSCDYSQIRNIGDTTTAKIYVKFLDAQGVHRPVAGHRITLRFRRLITLDRTVISDPVEIATMLKFAVGTDEASSAEALTDQEGVAQVLLKAKDKALRVQSVELTAEDRTQWAQ